MTESGLVPIAAVLAALAGAWFTYMTGRRQSSGQISTTDANTLWNQLNAHIARLEKRIEGLEQENRDLRRKVAELTD